MKKAIFLMSLASVLGSIVLLFWEPNKQASIHALSATRDRSNDKASRPHSQSVLVAKDIANIHSPSGSLQLQNVSISIKERLRTMGIRSTPLPP